MLVIVYPLSLYIYHYILTNSLAVFLGLGLTWVDMVDSWHVKTSFHHSSSFYESACFTFKKWNALRWQQLVSQQNWPFLDMCVPRPSMCYPEFQCCSHFLGVFGGSSYRAIMFEKFTSRPKDSLNCWILQWLAGVKGWSLIHPKPKKQEAFRDQRWNKQHSYTKTFFAAPKLGLHRQMSQKDQKLERSILMLVKWSKGFDPTMETFLNVTIHMVIVPPKSLLSVLNKMNQEMHLIFFHVSHVSIKWVWDWVQVSNHLTVFDSSPFPPSLLEGCWSGTVPTARSQCTEAPEKPWLKIVLGRRKVLQLRINGSQLSQPTIMDIISAKSKNIIGSRHRPALTPHLPRLREESANNLRAKMNNILLKHIVCCFLWSKGAYPLVI